MARQVTDADFTAEVLQASEPVLVDFWAEWCQPCLAMDPIMDALSVDLAGRAKIVKLDVASNPGIVSQYGVRNMPTLMVFKNGQPADIKVGAGQSRVQLVKWLESHGA